MFPQSWWQQPLSRRRCERDRRTWTLLTGGWSGSFATPSSSSAGALSRLRATLSVQGKQALSTPRDGRHKDEAIFISFHWHTHKTCKVKALNNGCCHSPWVLKSLFYLNDKVASGSSTISSFEPMQVFITVVSVTSQMNRKHQLFHRIYPGKVSVSQIPLCIDRLASDPFNGGCFNDGKWQLLNFDPRRKFLNLLLIWSASHLFLPAFSPLCLCESSYTLIGLNEKQK